MSVCACVCVVWFLVSGLFQLCKVNKKDLCFKIHPAIVYTWQVPIS